MYFPGKGWHSDVVVPTRFTVQFNDLRLNPNQVCFLYCFIATCGHIGNACAASRVNRSTHSWWLSKADNHADYTKAFDRVKPIAAQALLDKAIERAAHGVEEPVFYKGEVVGFVQKYSDNLMIRLLEGEMPEKYRRRQDVQVGNVPDAGRKFDPGQEVLSPQLLSALLSLGQKKIDADTSAIIAANRTPDSEIKPEIKP